MRKFKQKAALTLTTAAMLAGSVVVSSPANAASTPYAACGGGSYREIDHHDLGGVVTFYLMYNGSTDCVVAWKTANVGTPTDVAAIVERQSDGHHVADDGKYSYYAGPVQISAPGTCIDWGGNAGSHGYWESGWGHCG